MSDVESIPDETLGGLLDEVQEAEPEHPASEAEEAPDENAEKKTVKPKRVIKNPRPKLNEQTLKTPRGLPAIEKCFERVKFKGKGHEEKDLDVLMKTYEYWCHRMFPKYPFDDCIEKLEKLGVKKATQVYLKRIRMGIVDNDNNDDEVSTDKEDETVPTDGFVDEFNRVASQPALNEEDMERIRRNRERAEEKRRQRLENITRNMEVNTSKEDLTQEQLERIRINRENAEKLRQKRLQPAEGEVQLDQTLEDLHENNPDSIQKRKRLQMCNDEETEEFHDDVSNSNEGLEEPHNENNEVSTVSINEENADLRLIQNVNEKDAIPIRKRQRLQVIDSDEEIEDTHHFNDTSTADGNEITNENNAGSVDELPLDQMVRDINEDVPILNKKSRSVLNSDEEMGETQYVTNNKVSTADRNDGTNEEITEPVLINLEEVPLDQIEEDKGMKES